MGILLLHPRFSFPQSAEDFGKGILEDLNLNFTTLNLLRPGELNPNEINSDVMSYAIMMDSFGILHAANRRVLKHGEEVTGVSLERALRRVGNVGQANRKPG